MDHCWGIVRALVADMLLKLEDGKFLLVKDPNKDLLRLHSMPQVALGPRSQMNGQLINGQC